MSMRIFQAFAYLLILWILASIVSHIISPLRTIPGPFAARFTKLWFFYRVWQGKFHEDNIALHRKYGAVVRYAPRHYSFNTAEAVKAIYLTKGRELDKSSWYSAWNAPGINSLFTEPSVKAHAQLRRKFQSTYSISSLVTYEEFADHCIGLMKEKLNAVARSHGQADMATWFLCYAADTVAMISYSKRMGFLDRGEDVDDFFKILRGNMFYNTTMGVYSALHPIVYKIRAWLAKLKVMPETPRMSIGGFTTRLVSEKRKQREGKEKHQAQLTDEDGVAAPKDFLSKFLEFNEQDPSRFTERDIQVGLMANVIAGADTTAAALSAILYCLLRHSTVLAKLRSEIDGRLSEGELSSPPSFKEVQQMPYLHAVIQESQRLYPQGALPLQRVVPEGGLDISGHSFPAGTVVGVNSWVLHLNTDIFGEDAALFRPERWLDSDREQVAYMNRHFMTFGLGSRACIGKHVSMLEMSKLVPELVRSFDFGLEEDKIEHYGASWEWIAYWLMRPTSLPVQIRRRQV
ncbi:uncharacterized protein LTR77_000741 [Saxophila tyrrhenica]|uniref:Cytochrome P450 n=1 Tax=Saxophila tyrrhenica TaxID=1690608 RepID=A0AAV9PS10_9PEZI|nr:hypothetical protein LTR77_000741 [Saxophila tyrrhenica]